MNKKKILIIEDDPDLRKNLSKLLESEGYEVECAENGRIALDDLQASPVLPNLILLDLMMPVMDGFQFRQKQASIPRLAQIPIAIMTADGQIMEKQQKIEAQGSLRKPASINVILDLVDRLTV